jgi:hypothetical protein
VSAPNNSNSNQSQQLVAAVIDENVNTNKMIQQSVNVQAQPPRLHPKKRKFDLSELEDDHNQQQATMTAVSAVHSAVSSPVIISSNPSSTSSLATSSSTVVYQHHHNHFQQQRIPSEMIVTSHQQQNGNQQNVVTTSSVGYNPHITQIVKNTGEVQQIIKRQSFMNYR